MMAGRAVAMENGPGPTPERMESAYPKWAFSLLWCALVVYLAWQAVSLTWIAMGYSPNEEVLVLPAASGSLGDTASTSGGNRQSSLSNLFGSVEVAVKLEQNPQPAQAPVTNLRLKLMGVFTATDPSRAGAIIEDASREAIYYKVGSSLPGNAELIAVYEDHVLLRRSGREEVLRFAEEGDKEGGVSIAARAAPTARAAAIRTPEEFISEADQRLGENPQAALGSVGLSVVTQGKADGYVFNGNNPMLSKLNLQKGDIIRSVNGHPLGDITQDRKLVRELYQQGNIMVEVERDGTFFSVNYPLN